MKSIQRIGNYFVKPLDKRFTGYKYFKFVVEPQRRLFIRPNHPVEDFNMLRNWCWDQFGPALELRNYHLQNTKPVWCWDSEYNNLRIYLQTDQELAQFILTWS